MHPERKVSVIGLGYVGLPVAVGFARRGRVIAFDIKSERIAELSNFIDTTHEISTDVLRGADIHYTVQPGDLAQADFHIIAVPTPINQAKYPDLTALLNASRTLGAHLKRGDIVVYESTVYPGATEEECIPVLESASGLRAGKDFFVGYSPERINPGDKIHTFSTITKIVSAQNLETLAIVADMYGSVISADIYRAPSIKVAEAAKIIENTQRDLNIALMNELALIFSHMGIDTGDVLAAAGTKWNFLNFKPGLVGGHCIGVDPYYLTYRSAIAGYIPDIILAGRSINDGMGISIAARVIKGLIQSGNRVKDCMVTILGLTFKENVSDIRNTRVIDIIRELQSYGVQVQVHDVHASPREALSAYAVEIKSYQKLQPAHAVILAVSHREYLERGWDLIESLLVDRQGYVFDVQRTLDRASIPAGVVLERL
ncbi:MAG: GDP-mannose dehydrogenase [Gammaproteobacteria bacterium]|nr:GDP-mannose dehydrogenase [Gammaproteobacteria bacterium]